MGYGNSGPRPVLAKGVVRGWHRAVVVVVVLAALLAIGFYASRNGIRPEELAALGYPGVFLVMLASGAITFLPAPSQATVLVAGALWNPIVVGIVAGLGNATGELAGYALGRAGIAMIPRYRNRRWLVAVERVLSRYGFFAILAMALVPNPIFDVVGLVAGSLGFPIQRFWLACALGNSAKYIGMAYVGEAAGSWLGIG